MTRPYARPRVAVLGDDLTGAADAAAPFARRGLAVSVAIRRPLPQDVDVLALVTDSRWRSKDEAAKRVGRVAVQLQGWRPRTRFVKIDSTLRGRVHEDVSTALAAWGGGAAVAAPAFPAQGRLVRDGVLHVHGEPLVPRVADLFPAGVRVVDAVTHEDLLAVAREVIDSDATAIGSGGLARALAEVLVHPRLPCGPRPGGVLGVLVVAGTQHPVTREQVAVVVESGAAAVVLGGTPAPVEAAATALREGRRVVLTCAAGPVETDSPAAVALAGRIASTVRDVLGHAPGAGLVLTGGATALAVATALGAVELRVRSEVSQGLPLGELVVGDRRIPVVTKSGGFGDLQSLNRAAEALEART